MTLIVDIPAEELIRAIEAIHKQIGICKHPPAARFYLSFTDGPSFPVFEGLLCDGRKDKMGMKSTGTAAGYCTNCIKDSK